MAETYFFIQLQNTEPFMMSIDKEVNYQTFDEEIKKRFSKSTEDNLLYTFLSANGESITIQNDEDLSNALTFAESLGDDFLFVINVTENPKNVGKVEGEKVPVELNELEELEKLVPEEQKDSSFSIPISGQKEDVKEENKYSEKKDGGFDLFEILKNQISEQLPALSPFLGSLNFENLINNINNDNNKEENDVLEEIPNIIKQFLPVVLDNLQNIPKVSIPCPPPPPPHYMRFPQAFSCPPPPPPAPHVRFACSQNPFMQSFAYPNIRSMPAFVPPSSQPQNPLHSLFEMLLAKNATQSQQQKQQEIPKSPVCHMAVCDHCSNQIIGIRYKCLNCPNFDFCEGCEVYSPQFHNPDHVFAKIRTANQFVAPRIPVPPQCRRPVNQTLRSVHPQPHFCEKPPVKLNVIRPHPPPSVQFPPQVRPHPVASYMRPYPKAAPENDKIKTLEEQIASLESSIASIKSSLAAQKEEKPRPRPTRRPIFNYPMRGESDDSDESDGSDDSEGEDQVFEVKVNRRW